MRLLRDDLQHFLRRKGLRQGVEAVIILQAVRQVLPTVIPRHLVSDITVESYHDGLLRMRVESGSALAAVNQYKSALLSAIKKRLGRAKVERIQILAKKITSPDTPPDFY